MTTEAVVNDQMKGQNAGKESEDVQLLLEKLLELTCPSCDNEEIREAAAEISVEYC